MPSPAAETRTVLSLNEAGLVAKTQKARSGNVTEDTSCETRATKFRTHSTTILGAVLIRNT